jgi:hypothetical protein
MKIKIHSAMKGKNYLLTEENNTLILTLITIDGDFVITIPKVYEENSIKFVDIGGVIRPTHSYLIIKDGKEIELSFEDFIFTILFGKPEITGVMKGRLSAVARIYRIANGRDKNYTRYLVNTIQIFINRTVNETLPLHTTNMNSWAINNRIDILDEKFNEIMNPNKKLDYQVAKADKHFNKGWSAMGMSESTLSERNYLLTEDLRKYVPFGIKHHNPQRNLYQTLGMKGDELPIIRTRSQQALSDKGINRTGWAVPTIFIDLPLNFEDQILIDKEKWEERTYSFEKSYTVYGEIFVKEGDEVEYGDVIGISLDNHPVVADMLGEKLIINKIIIKHIAIEGKLHKVYSVKIKVTRNFKEGFKITNLAGNKGIVKLIENLGVINDPVYGDIEAEVIVSLTSINKRKNFGQVCEAVLSRVIDDPIVIRDDAEFKIDNMRQALRNKGYTGDTPECVEVTTPFGTFKAIWGYVFWGCIKTPEDQLWLPGETFEVNSKGLRKMGLKFSTVEIRALETQFGHYNNKTINPVIKEILHWQQGKNHLQSKIKSLKYLNKPFGNYKKVKTEKIRAIDITQGFMIPESRLKGTICDPKVHPNGFILQLPKKVLVETTADTFESLQEIFIPQASTRKYWQHSSGLYSVDNIGKALNYIIYCSQFKLDRLETAVNTYFSVLVKSLSTKKGEIAQLGMGIRYPHSAKATASLGRNIPNNTIEIHKSMANQIGVKTGDAVLVERFPCLGFMSIRPQYIQVTDDEQCRFVIRAGENYLCSLNLDFDGDTLFIASFKSRAAKDHLRRLLMYGDSSYTNKIIMEINSRKVPQIMDGGFDVCSVISFPTLTKQEHHKIIKRATGVKAHTGPVIALAYNLMRLVEGCIPHSERKTHADIEVLLDVLGNSVFAQKHGIRSLQEDATDAICSADSEKMFELGFDKSSSEVLCSIIKTEARNLLGIVNLKGYHDNAKQGGKSNIISVLVKTKHKLYFASRSILSPCELYTSTKHSGNDVPSFIFRNYREQPSMIKSVNAQLRNKTRQIETGQNEKVCRSQTN